MEQLDYLLKNAADLRDAIIFLASAVYVFGYVTWSSYSNYRKLGTVKALDAQYFVIGLPVAISMPLVIFLTSKFIEYLKYSWYKYVFSLEAHLITTITLVLWALIIAVVLSSGQVKNPLGKYALYALGFLMVGLIPETDSFFSQLTTIFFTFLFFLLILGIVIYIYVTRIYERIPHNFGGGRSRIARLDLIKNAVSPSLLKRLVDNQADNSIVQSRDVTVVSTSGDWILIRVGKIKDSDSPIIEIPRNSIASIVWLTN